MKTPDEAIGGSRKSLLKRKTRPVPAARQVVRPKRENAKNPLDRDVEADLVKTFGQK